MGLTGSQLEACFGSGFSPVKAITGIGHHTLNKPSTAIMNPEADVQEQQVSASLAYDEATGELKITSAADGEGLWVPYLGNGKGKDGDKGWGTYTKAVAQDVEWVATGPFSGCFVAAFQSAGMRFAHLITTAAGHPCASVDAQVAAIAKATGGSLYGKWPMNGTGLGIAFFLRISGAWSRRFAWVSPGSGSVVQINATSTAL